MEGLDPPFEIVRPAALNGPPDGVTYSFGGTSATAAPTFSVAPLPGAVLSGRTNRRVFPGFTRIKPARSRDGINPTELFVRRLATASTAQTERLLERELWQSTKQHVELDFRDGDPHAMRLVAVAAAHYFRLHEVKLPSLSVTEIPQNGHGVTVADAHWIGGVRLDVRVFGNQPMPELAALLRAAPVTHPAHGNITAFRMVTAFHEFDHLRQGHGRNTPPDILPQDFLDAAAEEEALRTEGYARRFLEARGEKLETYTRRVPELLAVNEASVTRQHGSHAATNKSELSAETSGVAHWSGHKADWVTRAVTTALYDNFPRIVAAAPAARAAASAVSPGRGSAVHSRYPHLGQRLSPSQQRRAATSRETGGHNR